MPRLPKFGMCGGLVSQRWDAEYSKGKYVGEGPIKFVQDIMDEIKKTGNAGGHGLYVGCGNGRNYIPLAESGLDIIGIDTSRTAIEYMSEKNPRFADKLLCDNLNNFDPDTLYDYIIAIQVFQHGTDAEVSGYFDKVSSILKRGGLLFLRVNSTSTDILFDHTTTEKNSHGGFTILYRDGPKRDLQIHFFTDVELQRHLQSRGFEITHGPDEDFTSRDRPESGVWSQWETISEKR